MTPLELDPRTAALVAKLRAKKPVKPTTTAKAVTATSPEVTQIVAAFTPEQRTQYTALAAQQGVTVEQLVEQLLAQQSAQADNFYDQT